MNNSSESLVKTSFFDDYLEPESEFSIPNEIPTNKKNLLWIKLKNISQNFLLEKYFYFSETKLFEGQLMKKSRKHKKLKTKYYVLYKDRLVQMDNEKSQDEKGFMPLRGVKIEILDNSSDEKLKNTYQKFCLIFTHNKSFFILYATTWDLCDLWYNTLKQCCILSYFAKSFTNSKIIGKGSFAKVLLSKRNTDGMEFAVKTFDKKLCASKSKKGLINEIILMRILEHPNIIKLYEIYEGDYHIYLVCELLKGGELFERIIKKGHYSEKDACLIIAQLLSALDYLHSKGIMHRDIKPENLLLKNEENFEVKLADFGLADFVNRKDHFYKRCGTPGYVAPEILNDEDYDTKVDIFSTGVILYVMLTGTSPFYGKTYNEILFKNKKCEVNFNFTFLKHKISDDAMNLMQKMLTKDPKERISAIDALNHEWILKYAEVCEEIIEPDLMKEYVENMKNNLINEKNIENMETVTSTPIMNGQNHFNFNAENPFNSPAFNLTPCMTPIQKKEDNLAAMQSLRGMIGLSNLSEADKVKLCYTTDGIKKRSILINSPVNPYNKKFIKEKMSLQPIPEKKIKNEEVKNNDKEENVKGEIKVKGVLENLKKLGLN